MIRRERSDALIPRGSSFPSLFLILQSPVFLLYLPVEIPLAGEYCRAVGGYSDSPECEDEYEPGKSLGSIEPGQEQTDVDRDVGGEMDVEADPIIHPSLRESSQLLIRRQEDCIALGSKWFLSHI